MDDLGNVIKGMVCVCVCILYKAFTKFVILYVIQERMVYVYEILIKLYVWL